MAHTRGTRPLLPSVQHEDKKSDNQTERRDRDAASRRQRGPPGATADSDLIWSFTVGKRAAEANVHTSTVYYTHLWAPSMILLLIQRPDKQMIVWKKVSEDVEGRCWKYVCHLILALLYNKQSVERSHKCLQ